MKNLTAYSNPLMIILAIALIPFHSMSQDNSGPQAEIFVAQDEVSKPESHEVESNVQVSEIKKMTRYSIGFVVDVPTMNDVLVYMNNDLGIEIQADEQMNDPNWNPTSCSTRNYQVVQNENGAYEVKVRFYPPADPMSIENVDGIQRKSKILRSAALEQLKADQVQ